VEVPDVARRASWAVFLKVHGRGAAGGKGQTDASGTDRDNLGTKLAAGGHPGSEGRRGLITTR
jgi:hypothetical protein